MSEGRGLGAATKVGVVSDTHGYFDPLLTETLAGVKVILHAGDVGSEDVLESLERIAPVYAVRGNVDSPEVSLPPSRELELAGCHIELMHILPFPPAELEALGRNSPAPGEPLHRAEELGKAFQPTTEVVIFGHTHAPCRVWLGRRLFFNPGAAGKKRFTLPRSCGVLKIGPDGITAHLYSLESASAAFPSSSLGS